MDHERFDVLVRRLGVIARRRDVLLSLAPLGLLNAGHAAEKQERNRKPSCPRGTTRCGGRCVDTDTSAAHCGGCGATCAEGQACEGGRCTCTEQSCDGCCDGARCRAGTKAAFCGANGQACDACTGFEACRSGACKCVPEPEVCGARTCGTVADRCGDDVGCGSCDAGQACTDAGACACTAESCDGCCAGETCVDTQTSREHCGACGHACGAGQTCRGGSCVLRVCPDCGYATVQDAVDAAADGDTIDVAAGLHQGDVLVDKDLSIAGEGRTQTVLQGGGAGSVVRVRFGKTVLIRGVTIRGGDGDRGAGGGIHTLGTLTLEDSTVTDNKAGRHGGGIFNGASLTVRRCTIRDNTADGPGGGIINDVAGTGGIIGSLTVEESVIRGNVAALGGGVHNVLGVVEIRDECEIVANEADEGGGVSSDEGIVTVTDSVLRRNFAIGDGGGAVRRNGAMSFSRCTIEENEVRGRGGGIHNYRGPGSIGISDCTIANNTARDGGGLSLVNNGAVTLSGSTVSGNRAVQGGGIWLAQSQLTLTDTDVTENTATAADPAVAGGGIFVDPAPTSTVALNGTSEVSGNSPNNCVNTPACSA